MPDLLVHCDLPMHKLEPIFGTHVPFLVFVVDLLLCHQIFLQNFHRVGLSNTVLNPCHLLNFAKQPDTNSLPNSVGIYRFYALLFVFMDLRNHLYLSKQHSTSLRVSRL